MITKKKIEEIREIKKRGFDGHKRREILRNSWQLRSVMTNKDKLLWHKFIENAEKGKIENNNRFRLKYVFDLNINWNILIFLGKKNIGKTYEMVKLINRTVEEDNSEIIILRQQSKEAASALHPLLNRDPRSKVMLKHRGGGYYELVHKEKLDEKGKPKICGFFASITTLQTYQGASYDNVKYIIWDECVSDDGRVKITKADLEAFDRFLSSTVRDKTDTKIIIFGNLLKKVDDVAGDAVLNHFGIPIEANLKYIEGGRYESSLLFINSRDMFKGIESQKVLGGIDQKQKESLLSNTVSHRGIKTVGNFAFLESEPKYALAFTYNKISYVLYISDCSPDVEDPYWILYLTMFSESTSYDHDIYTNDANLYNNFSHILKAADDDSFLDAWEGVINMCWGDRVLYADDYTASQLTIYMHHFNCELKTKRGGIGRKKRK